MRNRSVRMFNEAAKFRSRLSLARKRSLGAHIKFSSTLFPLSPSSKYHEICVSLPEHFWFHPRSVLIPVFETDNLDVKEPLNLFFFLFSLPSTDGGEKDGKKKKFPP